VPPAGERGNLGQRLQRADLVVGVHRGDQDGVRTQRLLELRRVKSAVAADRQAGDAEPEAGQSIAGGLGRGVLDRRGDDVRTAPCGAQRLGGTGEREMVALGAR
jgi:hypothetical protein